MTKKISCIIAAYNEAPRIGSVLRAVVGHPLVDEIIVVDDGSTDGTADVAHGFKEVQTIILKKNGGKSKAFMNGFMKAKNDLIMMIDADLDDLQPENITQLIQPVIEERADMTISMRKNSLPIYKLFGIDFVSGERVFPKSLIPSTETLRRVKGFELEVFINKLAERKNFRITSVPWKNVSNLLKYKKFGFWDGWKRDLKLIGEIIHYMSIMGVLRQYMKMRSRIQ